MNDFGNIFLGAGFKDSLNPCIFVTSAVFIVFGFWLPLNPSRISGARFIFGLSYLFGFLLFNFGPGQLLVFNKNFILGAKIIYFALGLGALVLGVLFFKDWILLNRKKDLHKLTDNRLKSVAIPIRLKAVVLGLVLSALATLWPVSNYVILLGNAEMLKGQWLSAVPHILGYAWTSMWPVWSAGVLLSIKILRPSFIKIFCAAIFFTASSSMILIFK